MMLSTIRNTDMDGYFAYSNIKSWFILSALCLTNLAYGESFIGDCLIEPTQQVAVGVAVTGVIDKVFVNRGDKVTQGQVIATLASGVEHASVQLSKYKAEQVAALQLATRKVEFSQRKFDRRQTMMSEHLMPEQDSDDAEAEFRLAQAELLVAQENHQLALRELQQQTAQLAQKTIRSPLTGVVVEQNAYVGEVVEPNSSSKPVFKLAQLDPLRVQVILPKSRFGAVQVGRKVDVVPEKPMMGRYSAQVKTVDKLLDSASGTFVVFLALPNKQLAIPAGVKCQAFF